MQYTIFISRVLKNAVKYNMYNMQGCVIVTLGIFSQLIYAKENTSFTDSSKFDKQ